MSAAREGSGAVREMPPGLTRVRRLGGSPLSEVFLVVDSEGHRRALKVLRGSAARDPRIRERWRREAELLEEIRHPNLVRSFGALEAGGRPALLLEYVDGPSLRERLQEGPLPWEEAVRVGVQVARALERLHRAGALHRDVKPHNILLHPERGAVLADLGLVRRREDPTLTRQGAALGSPAYMSPEQARDPSRVGPEADVYSLGATLHHALSGRPPFLGEGVGEVLHRVLHLPPDPLPPSVPSDLARVLATAMAKDPEERYARVKDLKMDLGRVLLGQRPRLRTRRGRRRARRRSALAAAAALLLLALALGRPWEAPRPAPALRAGRAPAAPPAAPPSAGAPAGEPSPTGSSEPSPPAASDFAGWAAPFQLGWERSLRSGGFRDALAHVDELRTAPLPAGAGAEFAARREQLVRTATEAVRAAAERTAARAQGILRDAAREARASLEAGALFDGGAFRETVRRRWDAAGLVLRDLPLREGDADPVRELEAIVSLLSAEQDRVLEARAAESLPPVRRLLHGMLRSGDFLGAQETWEDLVDPWILRWSRAGRREGARIRELADLERRILDLFDRNAGRWKVVVTRLATLSGVVEYRQAGSRVIRLRPGRRDPGGGESPAPVSEIRVLDLDADAVLDLLGIRRDAHGLWLQAQFLWCQGEVAQALETMRLVGAARLDPDLDPAGWIEEWTAELQEEAGGAAEAPPSGGPPVVGEDPLELLGRRLRKEHPDARVEIRDGRLEILWEDLEWRGTWERLLRLDEREGRLTAWELHWRLPAREDPPRLLEWLDAVRILQPSRSGIPVLEAAGERRSGTGIVPGALQTLSWEEGILRLDGLPLGPWEPPAERRLRLRGRAEPRLSVSALRLVIRRRP